MDINKHIICGKFDNIINFDSQTITNQRIRIGSKNPNHLKEVNYIPIAVNNTSIIYKDEIYDIRDFLAKYNREKLNNLIVLTSKERELILDELVDFDVAVKVFEINYPIFSHIKYISNIHKNYNELKKLLTIIKGFSIKGDSLAHNLSTQYLYKIERKLRHKNKLDYFFAFAYKGGYSEVFKLKEERKDRVIIALDYNSMFVDSMIDDFVEPKTLRYKKFNNKVSLNNLENGLYRVILENATNTFFKRFHPFKYIKMNQSFLFELEENQCIELLLFKNEIEYYKKFFDKVEIIEGFYSLKTIRHPLEKYAKEIYKERLNYKEDNNKLMESLSKFKLITIHSSTNAKRFKTLFFNTKEEIVKYISLNYMISFPENITTEEKLLLIQDNRYFSLRKYKHGYKVKVINYKSYDSVFSLSSQILANSRLKMVRTIEKFLLHPSVEICYINIDSIHISILESEANNFIEKHKNIISNKLGDFKIESISERGYWFDVGRYWLFTDKNVDLYKNSFFNRKTDSDKFIKNRKIKFISKAEGSIFSFVKTTYMSIFNTFSYNKKVILDDTIDNSNFGRYNYSEICNLDVAEITYNNEVLKSKNFKINLYNKIATVED